MAKNKKSRFIDTKQGYISIILEDILKSCGNPLIGHRLPVRYSKLVIDFTDKKREDVYFDDFMSSILNKKVGSLVYYIPPLQQIYLDLKRKEQDGISSKNFAELGYKLDRDLVLERSVVRGSRLRMIQKQYEHAVMRNAVRVLETNFPDLKEVSENI